MKKITNGKQCTIVWHIGNLMISHAEPKVVTNVINKLSTRYGDIMPLTINCRKVHKYLGMMFEFANKGNVKINMYRYADSNIEGALDVYKINFIKKHRNAILGINADDILLY